MNSLANQNPKLYRPCMAMVLFNTIGMVFVAERNDTLESIWQLPQGGIDKGESQNDAALRELLEEIGTNSAVILKEENLEIFYDWPDFMTEGAHKTKYNGQRVKLVALKFTGIDKNINLNTKVPEFKNWKWVVLEELPKMTASFKKPLYELAVKSFKGVRNDLKKT